MRSRCHVIEARAAVGAVESGLRTIEDEGELRGDRVFVSVHVICLLVNLDAAHARSHAAE